MGLSCSSSQVSKHSVFLLQAKLSMLIFFFFFFLSIERYAFIFSKEQTTLWIEFDMMYPLSSYNLEVETFMGYGSFGQEMIAGAYTFTNLPKFYKLCSLLISTIAFVKRDNRETVSVIYFISRKVWFR